MAILSNLFPPILPTYTPAFIYTESCKIYFSLSNFNVESDILNAQVSVRNQKSNENVFKTASGIKLYDLKKSNQNTQNNYYIEIFSEDLKKGFKIDEYYKVQIRFTSSQITQPEEMSDIGFTQWLAQNTEYFSEWSTVCLIKGISRPHVEIDTFQQTSSNGSVTLSLNSVDLVGAIYFEDKNEDETLRSYRIKMYDNNKNLIIDSGDLYTNTYNSYNEFNYQIKYNLVDGESYSLDLEIVTSNYYTETYNYNFNIIQGGYEPLLNTRIYAGVNNPLDSTDTSIIENGAILVRVVSDNIFNGCLTIRRQSSQTNFTVWEDVHTESILSEEPLQFNWIDYTVEQSQWYRYGVQKRNIFGQRGITITTKNPVTPNVEDIFLIADGVQLRLQYDQVIQDFKRNIVEQKTDTIGSKFPFIRRNGSVNYRVFPISGTISFLSDRSFYPVEEAFKNDLQYYKEYNEINRISEINDYNYEKRYRDKVMEFLYKDNIKLLRTGTEGNILIKLTDITFAPNSTLGRYIYAFSATAYEMDECTLDNIDKYNIIKIGDYRTPIERHRQIFGQYRNKPATTTEIIANKIIPLLESESIENMITGIDYLSYVRFDFLDPYYKIYKTASNAITTTAKNNTYIGLGHLVEINGKRIMINQNGYYELRGNDTQIYTIKFPVKEDVLVDYVAETYDRQSFHIAKSIYYDREIGQIRGTFNPSHSILRDIYYNYYIEESLTFQRLLELEGVTIEADPGSVVYIKDFQDKEPHVHVINNSGTLQIYDEDSILEEIYFEGVHLTYLEDDLKYIPMNKYIINSSYNTIDEIQEPINNCYYTKIGKVYYHNEWYDFDEENEIVKCPVFASVDYYCEYMKGVYAE